MKLLFSVALNAVFLTWLMATRSELASFGSSQQPDDFKPERKATKINKIARIRASLVGDATSVFNDFDFDSFDDFKKCGYRKCFFLSKSNADFGYVVGHPSFFDKDLQAYELAKRLEEEDGINQPNTSPPEIVPMNAVVISEIGENRRFQNTNNSLVVSKVHTIKDDAILIGCEMHVKNGKNTEKLKLELPYIIRMNEDAAGFYRNFKESIETTKNILIKAPGLFNDMQIMVDKFGSVHHIDFDRAFQRNTPVPEDKIKTCFESLDDLVTMTLELLRAREKEDKFILG